MKEDNLRQLHNIKWLRILTQEITEKKKSLDINWFYQEAKKLT